MYTNFVLSGIFITIIGTVIDVYKSSQIERLIEFGNDSIVKGVLKFSQIYSLSHISVTATHHWEVKRHNVAFIDQPTWGKKVLVPN